MSGVRRAGTRGQAYAYRPVARRRLWAAGRRASARRQGSGFRGADLMLSDAAFLTGTGEEPQTFTRRGFGPPASRLKSDDRQQHIRRISQTKPVGGAGGEAGKMGRRGKNRTICQHVPVCLHSGRTSYHGIPLAPQLHSSPSLPCAPTQRNSRALAPATRRQRRHRMETPPGAGEALARRRPSEPRGLALPAVPTLENRTDLLRANLPPLKWVLRGRHTISAGP